MKTKLNRKHAEALVAAAEHLEAVPGESMEPTRLAHQLREIATVLRLELGLRARAVQGPRPVMFHLWHNGDPGTGIPGGQATVEMMDDQEGGDLKAALAEHFTALWDFPAHVITEAEMEAEAARERRRLDDEARR